VDITNIVSGIPENILPWERINNAKIYNEFDVFVTVHLRYNDINNQLDATVTIY